MRSPARSTKCRPFFTGVVREAPCKQTTPLDLFPPNTPLDLIEMVMRGLEKDPMKKPHSNVQMQIGGVIDTEEFGRFVIQAVVEPPNDLGSIVAVHREMPPSMKVKKPLED